MTVTSDTTNSSGFVVTSGNELEVASGGTATATIVSSGGLLQVDSGGVDTSATILAGGSAFIYGSASNDAIYGLETVSAATGTATTASVSNETVFSGGVLQLLATGASATGTVINAGSVYVSKSGTLNNTTVENGGTVTLNSAKALLTGSVTLSGTGNAIVFQTLTPNQSGSSYGDLATISGFGGGDVLDARPVAGGSLSLTTNSAGNTVATLSGTSGGVAVTQSFILAGGNANYSNLAAVSDGNGGTELVTCFASGTLIRTARGDVAVETLSVGDIAITASGHPRPIRWIGQRSLDCAAHPDPAMVRPICVQAGAFGVARPYRDLLLSPHHAVAVTCLGEVLVPIRFLTNGTTIAQQDDVGEITYWHIELDSHDVVLANGLPAESYIDVGNRCDFEGEGSLTLHPEFKTEALAGYCRPLVTGGTVLAAIRAQLFDAAQDPSSRDAAQPGFHLLVAGERIAPVVRGSQAVFVVPAADHDIFLVSSTFSPCEIDPASRDDRHLGLMIQAISVEDLFGGIVEVPLDGPALVAGFHPLESGADTAWRWTDGSALLSASLFAHAAAPRILRITGRFEPTARDVDRGRLAA